MAAIGLAAAQPPSDVLTLGRELRVRLTAGRELVFEVKPRPGEDAHAVAHRMEPLPVRTDRLAAILADPKRLTDDGFYRIPLEYLGAEARVLVLRTVFPQDRTDGGDWLHVARKSPLPLYDEGMWQVALWFTGHGSHFDELLRVNGLSSPELAPGQVVRIPAALLDDALLAVLAAQGTLGLFAAFFRIISAHDEATGAVTYAHSMTWAISDLDNRRYLGESRADHSAPKLGLERIANGRGSKDERLNRAMAEILERGQVPVPDRVFDGTVNVAADRQSCA